MWDPSSPTRDRTHGPCIWSAESYQQGSPFFFFFLTQCFESYLSISLLVGSNKQVINASALIESSWCVHWLSTPSDRPIVCGQRKTWWSWWSLISKSTFVQPFSPEMVRSPSFMAIDCCSGLILMDECCCRGPEAESSCEAWLRNCWEEWQLERVVGGSNTDNQ